MSKVSCVNNSCRFPLSFLDFPMTFQILPFWLDVFYGQHLSYIFDSISWSFFSLPDESLNRGQRHYWYSLRFSSYLIILSSLSIFTILNNLCITLLKTHIIRCSFYYNIITQGLCLWGLLWRWSWNFGHVNNKPPS